MSLKAFHFVFITLSSLLSLGLIYWGLGGYRHSGDSMQLILGIVGVVALGLLIPYFQWFRHKMSKLSLVLAVIITSSPILMHTKASLACSVCFGDPTSSLSKGINAGVIVLVLFIGSVLGAIAGIAFTWNKKAKNIPPQL